MVVVMQTIVTVGYGDYTAKKQGEYVFMVFLEFMGIVVMSITATTVMNLFKEMNSFKDQMHEKIRHRDIWVKKLE